MEVALGIFAVVAVILLFSTGGKSSSSQYELSGKVEDYLADAIKSFNENQMRYAEKSYKLALIKAKQSGAPERLFGRILMGLGTVYTAQGRYTDAESLLKEARNIYQGEYGVKDLRVAAVILQLAFNTQKLGRFDDAEQLFEECLSVQEEALNKDHPEVLKTVTALGHLYLGMNQIELAEDCYQRALNALIQGQKPLSPEQVNDFQNLVQIYRTTDRPSEAVDLDEKLRKMALGRAS